MSKFDDQYIDLCKRILAHGEKITNYKKSDKRSKKTASAIPDHRAQGTSAAETIRLPHQVLQFDLEEEFPILVSKQVGFKTAVGKSPKTVAIKVATSTKSSQKSTPLSQRQILHTQLARLTAGSLIAMILFAILLKPSKPTLATAAWS